MERKTYTTPVCEQVEIEALELMARSTRNAAVNNEPQNHVMGMSNDNDVIIDIWSNEH